MSELREIAGAAMELVRRGKTAVLATVVKVEGSAYRRPGARMLFPEDGPVVGMVSGGCLEADLAERAQGVLASGRADTVVYDMRSPDDIVWGLGLGCNGEVRVLLERIEAGVPPGWLEFLDRCARSRTVGAIVTVFGGSAVGHRLCLSEDGATDGTIGEAKLRDRLAGDAARALRDRRSSVVQREVSGDAVEAFVEFLPPRISLLVFGAGGDARPVVRLARQLGWSVTVVDDRPAQATAERFPDADAVELVRFDRLDRAGLTVDADTPALVMTHHFLHDLDILQFLLPSASPYVGLLGPRQRMENLLTELAGRDAGVTAEQLTRLYGPVGLDIGSETPEEIALSALAEIRAVLSGHDAGFLRDRQAALHEWSR